MKYTLKKYFTFSSEEIKSLIITILVIGFIASMNDWGAEKFDLIVGLKNFVNSSLIVALVFLVSQSAQRFFALKVGLKAEYKSWALGLMFSILLAFLCSGAEILTGKWIILAAFLAPGGIVIHMLPGLRLGHFRYQMSYITMGWISIVGPLSAIALAIFFKIMSVLPLNPLLIEKAIFISVWLAIFNMLPIPPLDGSKMMYASRFLYVLLLGFVVASAIFLLMPISIIWAIIGSAICALLVLILYWVSFESPV